MEKYCGFFCYTTIAMRNVIYNNICTLHSLTLKVITKTHCTVDCGLLGCDQQNEHNNLICRMHSQCNRC